jgi:hypothetical protein
MNDSKHSRRYAYRRLCFNLEANYLPGSQVQIYRSCELMSDGLCRKRSLHLKTLLLVERGNNAGESDQSRTLKPAKTVIKAYATKQLSQ